MVGRDRSIERSHASVGRHPLPRKDSRFKKRRPADSGRGAAVLRNSLRPAREMVVQESAVPGVVGP